MAISMRQTRELRSSRRSGCSRKRRERDAQFAVAWSYAARAHSIIFGLGLDPDAVHPTDKPRLH